MKTRRDFVSNSSSTSYILYIDDKKNVNIYFREICRWLKDNIAKCKTKKQSVDCVKNFARLFFDYIAVNTENYSKTLKNKIIKNCKLGWTDDNGIDVCIICNEHGIDNLKDDRKVSFYAFDKFYDFYLTCGEKIQKQLKDSIIGFVSNECYDCGYDGNDEDEDFLPIMEFCKEFDIDFKNESAVV